MSYKRSLFLTESYVPLIVFCPFVRVSLYGNRLEYLYKTLQTCALDYEIVYRVWSRVLPFTKFPSHILQTILVRILVSVCKSYGLTGT